MQFLCKRMGIVIWTCAFSLMLLRFGEALEWEAGYRTSSKGVNETYFAIIGKPLIMWVKYKLPKKEVKTVEMKKYQEEISEEFIRQFFYEVNASDADPFCGHLIGRASFCFCDDEMEITIPSLEISDHGMYLFKIETQKSMKNGLAHIRLSNITYAATSEENTVSNATTETHAIPSSTIYQYSTTTSGEETMNGSPSSGKTSSFIIVVIVILVANGAIAIFVIAIVCGRKHCKHGPFSRNSGATATPQPNNDIEMQESQTSQGANITSEQRDQPQTTDPLLQNATT